MSHRFKKSLGILVIPVLSLLVASAFAPQIQVEARSAAPQPRGEVSLGGIVLSILEPPPPRMEVSHPKPPAPSGKQVALCWLKKLSETENPSD